MLDRAVGVAHRCGAQIDVGRGELLDQGAQRVGAGQSRNLVAELEVVEDVLHVGREPVEVGREVGGELLPVGACAQIPQGEAGGVVERLPRCLAQGRILLDHAGTVERGFHVQDRMLAALQHGVEAAQHRHRQDYVAVLAAHIEIPQHIVGDAPNEVRDPVQVAVAHSRTTPSSSWLSRLVVRLFSGIVALGTRQRVRPQHSAHGFRYPSPWNRLCSITSRKYLTRCASGHEPTRPRAIARRRPNLERNVIVELADTWFMILRDRRNKVLKPIGKSCFQIGQSFRVL